jgi:hypothetical protein
MLLGQFFGCMASEGIMFDWSGVYFGMWLKLRRVNCFGYISFIMMARAFFR